MTYSLSYRGSSGRIARLRSRVEGQANRFIKKNKLTHLTTIGEWGRHNSGTEIKTIYIAGDQPFFKLFVMESVNSTHISNKGFKSSFLDGLQENLDSYTNSGESVVHFLVDLLISRLDQPEYYAQAVDNRIRYCSAYIDQRHSLEMILRLLVNKITPEETGELSKLPESWVETLLPVKVVYTPAERLP